MSQTRSKRKWPLVAGVIVAVVAAGGAAATLLPGDGDDAAAGLTFAAERGPLLITLAEEGTINAAEQLVLKSEVEGMSTVLSLIDEGQVVEEGDVLVELDTSELQDRLVDAEIAVENARAARVRAEEALAVARNQAEADARQAELDLAFAEGDVTKYVEGEYPKERMEATNAITIAEEEHERAKEKHDGSRRLFDESFISETELKADRLAMSRSALALALARENLKLLEKYTHVRKMQELESAVDQKRMALDRARRKAKADVVQAEADLRAAEAQLDREGSRVGKLEAQIAKGTIRAPRRGLVVYATSNQPSWRVEEPLAEGASVRERMELIHLPTAVARVATIKIPESSLQRVKVGMPVRVTVDALPGGGYWGRVASVAPLPDSEGSWLNPGVKTYETRVTIEGNGPELRTGMSCRAEIVIAEHDDVVYVPVQCVVTLGGEPTVFTPAAGGPVPVPVEVGQDNNTMVIVSSGLDEGDRVLLAPPLRDTGTTSGIDLSDMPDAEAGGAADEAGAS